jgi:hypothetical protein
MNLKVIEGHRGILKMLQRQKYPNNVLATPWDLLPNNKLN